MTKTELLKAYKAIKECIDFVLERDQIKFIVSEVAPNTYKGMRQYRDDFGQFLVYSGGDHGLLGEEYNIKFRALHDAMHYENELTFKFEDERILSDLTALEFELIASKLGYDIKVCFNVSKVITAEIKGQIDYYEKYNEYVTDQSKFIYDYFGLVA